MSYNYETEKANLFTEEGFNILLAVRDETKLLLAKSGACTVDRAISKATGSSWTMLAAIDFLIQKGELERVNVIGKTQNQLLIAGRGNV